MKMKNLKLIKINIEIKSAKAKFMPYEGFRY